MDIKPSEYTAMSHVASRWWGGPDPGRRVRLDVQLLVPTARGDDEVLALFAALVEPLAGGYRWRVSIRSE